MLGGRGSALRTAVLWLIHAECTESCRTHSLPISLPHSGRADEAAVPVF